MFDIKIDEVRSPEIIALLQSHQQDMTRHSPPESIHALDVESLRAANVTFWTAWEDDELAGCGALKAIDEQHGEIKSMRTHEHFLRRGIARKILNTIVAHAQQNHYTRLSLETGSNPAFKPATLLYEQFGFEPCPPFADYKEDPYSIFMSRRL